MSEISRDVLSRWRSERDKAMADPAWQAHLSQLESTRETVVKEMRSLLGAFLAEEKDLEAVRSEFDRRGRVEWNTFGVDLTRIRDRECRQGWRPQLP
jgi:hypothetical protein